MGKFESISPFLGAAEAEYHRQLERLEALKTKLDLLLTLIGFTFSVEIFQFQKADNVSGFLQSNGFLLLSLAALGYSLVQIVQLLKAQKYDVVNLVQLCNKRVYHLQETEFQAMLTYYYVKCISKNKPRIDRQFQTVTPILYGWVASVVLFAMQCII